MPETIVTIRERGHATSSVGAGLQTGAGPSAHALVSILIPCCGQLDYTRLCVPSVFRYSRPPFEIVFIDIASLDGTSEYCAGVAAASPVRVESIRSATAAGMAAAFSEAFSRARGEFLILLNNDTIVTDSWINQLVSLATMAPQVGLVGPVTNYGPALQMVDTIPYRLGPKRDPAPSEANDLLVDVEAVSAFAQQWRQQQRGQWTEVQRLGGFCLLIKREVLEKIGPLEVQSALGLVNTDQLCFGARQAGYSLALCRDLFIHNFGSRQLPE